MTALPVWVVMAREGEYGESWHPVAAMDHEPQPMEAARAVLGGYRTGLVPWPGPAREVFDRPTKLRDLYRLEQVPGVMDIVDDLKRWRASA